MLCGTNLLSFHLGLVTLLMLICPAACVRTIVEPSRYNFDTKASDGPVSTGDERGADSDDRRSRQAGQLPPIAIDGRFEDWDEVEVLHTDAVGDEGETGIDFTDLKIVNDEHHLFLLIDIKAEVELDWGHQLSLYLNCDGNVDSGLSMHGFGAEIRWVMGTRSGQWSTLQGTKDFAYADIGFRAAPTTSGSRFEMALERELLADMGCAGPEVRVALADDSTGAKGDIMPDGAEQITYVFVSGTALPVPAVGLNRPAGTIRLVSWNVLWSSILEPDKQEYFRRILQTLNPDIVCLQEIIEHEPVAKLFNEWIPLDEGWHYQGFSDRLTLSRYPVVWEWPDSYEPLSSKYTVVPIELPSGQMMVTFNAHLSFGSQDLERQQEVDSFIAYLRRLRDPDEGPVLPELSPFVLVGDLNLVGDSQQLVTLVSGDVINQDVYGEPFRPDWDDSNLSDLITWHTGARMAHTWQDDNGSFWPGRLDFFIYPDSVIKPLHQFILNTRTMTSEELSAAGLEPDDSVLSSDHLPLVVDFLVINN